MSPAAHPRRRSGQQDRPGGDRREPGQRSESGPEGEAGQQVTSPWEWVAAAIGVVLVLGAVGYLAYQALSGSTTLPVLTVEPVAVEAAGDGYVVRFLATNRSGATAATVLVEGELREGTSVLERAAARIDYLPAHSERYGGLFFENDPDRYELRISPRGYEEP